MNTAARLMTVDELWKLPDDNLRHELVSGELRSMPLNGFNHGVVVSRLACLLGNHCHVNKLGGVTGASGYILRRDPDTVRATDVAFVRSERLAAVGRPVNFWEGAPDLAVEVLSPSDTAEEVDDKVNEYLTAGTTLVWLVNPRQKTVTVHRSGLQPLVLREADNLDGGDVIPGFRCGVAELFV